MRVCIALLTVALLLTPAPTRAANWPHWRGPTRDGHTAESLHWNAGQRLPERETWSANVGAGASSPIVVGERLFTMGWRDGKATVYCLDAATGKEKWKHSATCPKYGRHAKGDQSMYRGNVYCKDLSGNLKCFRPGGKSGR